MLVESWFSYFEWVQNLTNLYWTEEEVKQRQEEGMVDAFKAVYDLAQQYKVNMRYGCLHDLHQARLRGHGKQEVGCNQLHSPIAVVLHKRTRSKHTS